MHRSAIGFCIASCFLLLGTAFAQEWEVQSHLPDLEWIHDVAFVNDTTVITVGTCGVIGRSTDAGLTWSEAVSNTTVDLRRVKFFDESHGWAVGHLGTILFSSDGGQTWVVQESGTSETLRGLDFLDPVTGWVVGWHGTVLFTQDGGQTWQLVEVGVPHNNDGDLLDVDFLNPSVGWIVGGYNHGWILSTTDGGENWSISEPSVWLGAVQAIDDTTMVACGASVVRVANGVLQYTYSGGSFPWRNLDFLSDSLGFMSGPSLRITTDGGRSWEAFPYPGPGSNIYGVDFIDTLHGIVGGADRLLKMTEDGGETWQNAAPADPVFYQSVSFSDPQHGLCAAINGDLFHTNDGGEHWNYFRTLPNTSLNKLCFLSENEVFAVGSSGKVVRSYDAGETWEELETPRPTTFHDFAFVGDRRWIVGDVGVIVYSSDGGDTWQIESEDVASWLHGVDFIDEDRGLAVGGYGTVMRTTNGGLVWSQRTIHNAVDVYDVDFVTPAFAVAVGNIGGVYRSFDGGNNWLTWQYDVNTTFYAVQFLDSLTGWVVGAAGIILHTTDGGETWEEQPRLFTSDLRDLVLAPPYAWASGDDNTILRTSYPTDSQAPFVPVAKQFNLTVYPNPFNPSTTLSFDLPQSGKIELSIFDVTGRLVETLENRVMPAGSHSATWMAARHASGVYFVNLRSDAFAHTERIILLK